MIVKLLRKGLNTTFEISALQTQSNMSENGMLSIELGFILTEWCNFGVLGNWST